MFSITWLDPQVDDADEPKWAVWRTECGTYRITWCDSTDEYTPCVMYCEQISANSRHMRQRSIGPSCATLEDAQRTINLYHCREHNLILA